MPTQTAPHIPENAPFSTEQRAWLNGMFAGLYSSQDVDPSGLTGDGAGARTARSTVTVLYGTQTGNAEGLAERAGEVFEENGYAPTVVGMGDVEVEALTDVERLLVVTSTYGEGDMPDPAKPFWDELSSEDAPDMDGLEYSVCGLGDSSYLDFCEAGKKVDRRLEELGGERIADREDCDVDYEGPFTEWLETVLEEMPRADDAGEEGGTAGVGGDGAVAGAGLGPGGDGAAAAAEPAASTGRSSGGPSGPSYSKNNPFPATLLANRVLNGEGSSKETRHVEVALTGSDLSYEVGDALGIVPANCPRLVDQVIRAMGESGGEPVVGRGGDPVPLREALLSHVEIGSEVPPALLEMVADRTGDAELARLTDPEAREERREFLWGREVRDFLLEYPDLEWDAAELVDALRPLTPRLYSISSSPAVHPNSVHTTVAAVRYEAHGRDRKGVCSTYLADRVQVGGTVPIYLQSNSHFGLPEEGDRPIVMVGPGTGIAPFRAFLQERRANGAEGRNWLFFGERHEETDFLYREELEQMTADGHLDRLDTAFSRDQEEKVYVQHRMREHADELFGWLEDGAVFYVCGDVTRMARDVDAALHEVIETEGGMSEEEAEAYVREIKSNGRYQRDVY